MLCFVFSLNTDCSHCTNRSNTSEEANRQHTNGLRCDCCGITVVDGLDMVAVTIAPPMNFCASLAGAQPEKNARGLSQGGSSLASWRGEFEGEARVEGAKRPRTEDEARTEGEAREEAEGGVWGGGSMSPSSENFLKL